MFQNNVFIKEFNSISECAKYINISTSSNDNKHNC